MKFCEKCGIQVKDEDCFCFNCGKAFNNENNKEIIKLKKKRKFTVPIAVLFLLVIIGVLGSKVYYNLKEQPEEIKEQVSEIPSQDIYEQYKEIVLEKEEKFGQLSFNVFDNNYGDNEMGYFGGVCFIKLMDFENDDVPELLLYYFDKVEESNTISFLKNYKFEIYQQNTQTGEVELVVADEGVYYETGDMTSNWIFTYVLEDGEYLCTGFGSSFSGEKIVYGASDGKIGVVKEFVHSNVGADNDEEAVCAINGAKVDETTYFAEMSKFNVPIWENENIYQMYAVTITDNEDISNWPHTLSVINDTRKKLGLEETSYVIK